MPLCRTSHEVRGLKCCRNASLQLAYWVAPHTRCVDWNSSYNPPKSANNWSHLTRGAWIEIETWIDLEAQYRSRTSHEVRGLKWSFYYLLYMCYKSHLTRGAWIEMCYRQRRTRYSRPSHLTRGAWIEIGITEAIPAVSFLSHLTRGAWIEIALASYELLLAVCRTSHEVRGLKYLWRRIRTCGFAVAPHTRCVDWNMKLFMLITIAFSSHLTRGAWIEIAVSPKPPIVLVVAPHTRCVDWNFGNPRTCKRIDYVAPHTRCVDWNFLTSSPHASRPCRTSHEVRGLKF